MSPTELKEHVSQLFAKCLSVMEKKNADYSSSNVNAFRNFEAVETLGITDTKTGMLVRLSDKLTRISNLLQKPPSVVEESMADSVEDAINYLALFHARLTHEKNSQVTSQPAQKTYIKVSQVDQTSKSV